MLSDPIGTVIRAARRQLGLSQNELARRCGISKRLVAELETGRRPNASLETTLELLSALGVSMQLSGPGGVFGEIRSSSAEALDRQARAARRRESWSGGHTAMHELESAPSGARSATQRFAAVSEVSRLAYQIAAAAHDSKPKRRAAARRK